MTAPIFEEPRTELPRDRWSRPLVTPPGGGKPVAYRRCTTFVGNLDDTYNLAKWQKRMVATGLAMRPDLLLRTSSLGSQPADEQEAKRWKKQMDETCEAATEAASASASATIGTALHALTERLDRGLDVGVVPDAYKPHLNAYAKATEKMTAVHIERFTVLDEFKIGGTPDRVLKIDGHDKLVIGDLKGLALTTPLPTPTGWTTMAAVQVGDQVLAADGTPCTVTVKSSTKRIGTYIVRFDDGSSIVCDSEHLWWTSEGRKPGAPTVKPIQQIIDTLHLYGQAHHRVPVAGVLQLPETQLPIDPYLLGCWLGDGANRGGSITKTADLFQILDADGHALGKEQIDSRSGVITRTVLGLTVKLRAADLLHDKHVPAQYLRASTEQRLRLLQGLMDTDGTWNTARSRAVFTTTTKVLALAFEELLCTLGQRPHLAEYQATGFGVTVTAYNVEWRPHDMLPFRLPRKAAKAATGKEVTHSTRRVIVAVDPGPNVETACIGVDSSSHTYLCGERMIPTHNTGSVEYGLPKMACQLAVYAHSLLYNHETGARAPLGDIDLERGLIIALDAKTGICRLLWIDLAAGWAGVQLANQVWDWRGRKNFSEPYAAELVPTLPINPTVAQEQARDLTAEAQAALTVAIQRAHSNDELVQLWTAAGTAWTPEMTSLATLRKAELVAQRHLQAVPS